MIRRYADRLAAHGVEDYDADVAWHDYRVTTLFAFVYPVVAGAAALDHVDDRARAICAAALERSIAAIVHLDCLELVGD